MDLGWHLIIYYENIPETACTTPHYLQARPFWSSEKIKWRTVNKLSLNNELIALLKDIIFIKL